MANKYLAESSGALQEVEGLVTSSGAGDAGKIPALDSGGKLDATMMPTGIAADITVAPASEDLAAGDFVNLWNDAGTLKARKADATTSGKEADGYTPDAVLTGANVSVYHEGTNDGVTGKTVGAKQYLSTTAGQTTETPPSASGNVVQYLGKARSTTEIATEIAQPIIKV